jgi:hypothetical protein
LTAAALPKRNILVFNALRRFARFQPEERDFVLRRVSID